MANKKLIALSLICVILWVGIAGAVIVVNQKDSELQTEKLSNFWTRKRKAHSRNTGFNNANRHFKPPI